jgi:two-component system OmpR family response regulator
MRVLVVDDEAAISSVIELALTLEGHEVLCAQNGADALAQLLSSRVDLILLDMVMPEVNGWEFAARYRDRPGPHAPIIAMSASIDAEQAARSMNASGYLAKPFDLGELLRRVQEHARRVA